MIFLSEIFTAECLPHLGLTFNSFAYHIFISFNFRIWDENYLNLRLLLALTLLHKHRIR